MPFAFVTDDIEDAVSLFLPEGHVIEVRALGASFCTSGRTSVISGYFNNRTKLVEAVSNIRRAKGVYVTMNPVVNSLLARAENRLRVADRGDSTSDANIVQRCWLLIDCDPAEQYLGHGRRARGGS